MDTESMPAWTLPELLVVMILSGLIFLALSEATDLVGRFTGYLTLGAYGRGVVCLPSAG